MPISSRTPFWPRSTTPTTTRTTFPFKPPLLLAGPSRTSPPTFAFPRLNPFLRGY
jgi:hypothetical protein